MKSLAIVTFLSLSILTTTASAQKLEERAPRMESISALQERQSSFFGGWALMVPFASCPSNADPCNEGSSFTRGCCPKGAACVRNSLMGALACCPPEDKRCVSTIGEEGVPVCGHPDWHMYKGARHPFCCPKGQIGYYGDDNIFGDATSLCGPDSMPLQPSQLATRLAQANERPRTGDPAAIATGAPDATRSSAARPTADDEDTPTSNEDDVDDTASDSNGSGGGSGGRKNRGGSDDGDEEKEGNDSGVGRLRVGAGFVLAAAGVVVGLLAVPFF